MGARGCNSQTAVCTHAYPCCKRAVFTSRGAPCPAARRVARCATRPCARQRLETPDVGSWRSSPAPPRRQEPSRAKLPPRHACHARKLGARVWRCTSARLLSLGGASRVRARVRLPESADFRIRIRASSRKARVLALSLGEPRRACPRPPSSASWSSGRRPAERGGG